MASHGNILGILICRIYDRYRPRSRLSCTRSADAKPLLPCVDGTARLEMDIALESNQCPRCYCCLTAATAHSYGNRQPSFTCKWEGDRRGSNPRPSLVPQSDDFRFRVLLDVAQSAYLSQFSLLAVAHCFWV